MEIVPDNCANDGGLVSVQLRDIIVTAGDTSEVWHKNAMVFISKRDEIRGGVSTFPAGYADQATYIQEQSDNIMRDFKKCLIWQVDSVLDQIEQSDIPPSAVDLTQVADCVSYQIAARDPLGTPPRGIFISPKNTHQSASISANFAACNQHEQHSQCIDAPGQSFGMGHVIAHAHYRFEYEIQSRRMRRGKSVSFLYAVNLPPIGPPSP